MRLVKFRGMTERGDWVKGLLAVSNGRITQIPQGYYISNGAGMPYAYRVVITTVGQYTGVDDENGVEIYEGDIVELNLKGEVFRGTVEYLKGSYQVLVDDKYSTLLSWVTGLRVVGHIYEDTERKYKERWQEVIK